MKKIIALILAMVMVVFAVAACGGDPVETTAPTQNTTATTQNTTATQQTTQQTTQATTTEPVVVVPDPYTAVCLYTLGAEPVAVNITTGEVVGKLTAAEGIELVGGNIYVVDVVPADGKATATKAVGAALITKRSTGAWTNSENGTLILKDTSYLMRANSVKNFTFNCYMDVAAMNEALGADNTLGKFGTLTVKTVDDDFSSFVFDGGEAEEAFTDYKWNFVYVSYDGSSLGAATGTEYTGSIMNARDIMYTAIDKAYAQDIGTFRSTWITTMRNYGGVSSVVTFENTYNGTTLQNYWLNKWQNELIPVQYASRKSSYDKLITGDVTEASVTAAYNEAVAATAAAQKALTDAVAANASVKALYDAMVEAEAAYTATLQPEYEARAAHETEKAKNSASQETAAALEIRNQMTAAMNEAKATYDAAKAAYDAAVAADASLAALAAALTDAQTAEKAATTNMNTINNYKTYAELNEKFIAAYNEVANVALWNTEDMANSPLCKMYGEVEEGNLEKAALPTFTYFYDAATDTYTVFVTSMKTDIMIEYFCTPDTSTSVNGNKPLT